MSPRNTTEKGPEEISSEDYIKRPATLLLEHLHLLRQEALPGPVLDLASGEGRNGLFLAARGLAVQLWDISTDALEKARGAADAMGVGATFKQIDLEQEGVNPLPANAFGAILVFRYLHRPLIPCIKKSLKEGGLLFYETFTIDQPPFGKPQNPDFLLNPGELFRWFRGWEVICQFEGILENPKRAVAQIVCRKPLGSKAVPVRKEQNLH